MPTANCYKHLYDKCIVLNFEGPRDLPQAKSKLPEKFAI